MSSLLVLALLAQPPHDPLVLHRWKHRVLVLHGDAPWLDAQLEALAAREAGNADRDLVIYRCGAVGCVRVGAERGKLDPSKVAARLDIEGPSVVLVGKDGGVKLRSSERIAVDAIYRRIDAMPMRQAEMRRAR